MESQEHHDMQHHIDSLERALETRGEIGSAIGIVMERFNLDHEAAVAHLVRLSQHANRKLSDLAEEIVRTGQLPDSITPKKYDEA